MPKVPLVPPLVPRRGDVLQVITVDRISTKNQDPKSNEDQRALLQGYTADRFDGLV